MGVEFFWEELRLKTMFSKYPTKQQISEKFFLQLLSRDYGPCKGGYLRECFSGPFVSFRISQSCFKALISDGNFKFDKFILARNWGSNLDPPFL